jgi:hypothetical protein
VLNEVQVDTTLRILDWVRLLEADAPGPACSMTPQDRITHRVRLKEWHSADSDPPRPPAAPQPFPVGPV